VRSFTLIVVHTVLVVCVWLFHPYLPIGVAAEHDPKDSESADFTKFSLEELKNVVIVSASKKPEMVSDTAAAVYVITAEDIRRSGATSIPEALRLAPGVHVARITATDWAINIRGLNGKFAQNLLVLIDGRSVYTPVFSGVFWDIQDTVMEDIDRIEVIRGPGATVWGANAVNGVINIITKNADQTQGGQAVALGGSDEQSASVRYGSTLPKGAYYRAYGKFFNRGNLDTVGLNPSEKNPNEAQPSDNWRSGRGGFRIDMEPGHGLRHGSPDSITLQGEAYSNRYDKEFERSSIIFPGQATTQTSETDTSRANGWHVLGNWQHHISSDSDTTTQVYFDRAEKDYDPSSGSVNTANLDFQHRLTLAKRHDIVWGFEYRFISDEFNDSASVSMNPDHLDQSLWSTFVQDEIRIVPDLFKFIVGSKFEYNEFTHLEIQPSIRALYTPTEKISMWGAISRAVRVPSRLELHGQTTDYVNLPNDNSDAEVKVVTHGNANLQSEELTAYELGLRLKPLPDLWLDTTAFYNRYSHLIGLKMQGSGSAAESYNLVYNNNSSGESYGFEAALDWKVRANWLLAGTYTYLHTQMEENKVTDPNIAELIAEGSNPRHSFSIRSYLDVTPKIDFDLWFRFVGRLPEKNIGSYTVLDARLAWRPYPSIELSLVGQNLLERGHEEFSSLEVKRSIYGKIDWKF
jgi:iron complex outermembrane receptor protein